MKTKLLTLSIATALSTLAVSAQAEVILYGKAQVSAGKTYTGQASSSGIKSTGSYIGFKGQEALGGDAKAIWQYEQGINFDGADYDSSNTYMSNMRDTFIGLSSERAGTLKLGKNSSAYRNVGSELNLFEDTVASNRSAFGRYEDRVTNSAHYTTPDLAGLTAEVTYGSDTYTRYKGTNASKSDVFAGALNYQYNDALRLGAGYQRYNNIQLDSSTTYANKPYLVGMKAAGSYKFNNGALLGAGYERLEYHTKDATVGTTKQNAMTVSGLYPIGLVDLKANYSRLFNVKTDSGSTENSAANIYTAGVDYNLSKRTKVGAFYSYIDNGKNSSYNFEYPLNVAGSSSSAVSTGENVRAVGATLSHRF